MFDDKGVQTFGMDDFTIRKLAVLNTPRIARRFGDGVRSDYILMDVPGYDPAKCFVMITPRVYAGYDQPGTGSDLWGGVPTYRDLGGTKIGIYTYANTLRFISGSGKWVPVWVENVIESVVEVVRVI